jgi:hypothetical protein
MSQLPARVKYPWQCGSLRSWNLELNRDHLFSELLAQDQPTGAFNGAQERDESRKVLSVELRLDGGRKQALQRPGHIINRR